MADFNKFIGTFKDPDKEFNDLYGKLIDNGYFTEDELNLVTNINGNTVESLNNAIYSRTGYRDWEQLEEDRDTNEDLVAWRKKHGK
jgi:hypothetical protein